MANLSWTLSGTVNNHQRYPCMKKIVRDVNGLLHVVYNGAGTLYYAQIDPATNQKIYDKQIAGGGLSSYVYASFAVSPDGQKIVLMAMNPSSYPVLYYSADGGATLSWFGALSIGYKSAVHGVYIDGDYIYVALGTLASPYQVWLVRVSLLDGSVTTLYNVAASHYTGADVAASGSTIYFTYGVYDPNLVAGTGKILKSTDGGSTFTTIYSSTSLHHFAHNCGLRVNFGANAGNDVVVASFWDDYVVSLDSGSTCTLNSGTYPLSYLAKYPKLYNTTVDTNGYEQAHTYNINPDGTLTLENTVSTTFPRGDTIAASYDFSSVVNGIATTFYNYTTNPHEIHWIELAGPVAVIPPVSSIGLSSPDPAIVELEVIPDASFLSLSSPLPNISIAGLEVIPDASFLSLSSPAPEINITTKPAESTLQLLSADVETRIIFRVMDPVASSQMTVLPASGNITYRVEGDGVTLQCPEGDVFITIMPLSSGITVETLLPLVLPGIRSVMVKAKVIEVCFVSTKAGKPVAIMGEVKEVV